jgi:hypothetical protein
MASVLDWPPLVSCCCLACAHIRHCPYPSSTKAVAHLSTFTPTPLVRLWLPCSSTRCCTAVTQDLQGRHPMSPHHRRASASNREASRRPARMHKPRVACSICRKDTTGTSSLRSFLDLATTTVTSTLSLRCSLTITPVASTSPWRHHHHSLPLGLCHHGGAIC